MSGQEQAQEETQEQVEEAQEQEQQTEATTEDPAETEAANEDVEQEAANEDTEPEAKEEPPKPEPKHQRKGGWQRRLEKVERERDMLLDRLVAQQSGQQPQQAQEQSKTKTAEQQAAEYIDSLVEQRLVAREAQQRQQQAVAEFARRTQEVRAQHPDFDEVVLSADAPVSQAVYDTLLTSENGPSIMYQLAKEPAELARINALPPLLAAREIGRLEAKASSTATPKTQTKTAIRPPAPPTKLGGSPAASKGDPANLPIAAYKATFRSKG